MLDALLESLTLALRWLWLSLLVMVIFWLVRRVVFTRHGKMLHWPWWLPLVIGAGLTAGTWVGWRCH